MGEVFSIFTWKLSSLLAFFISDNPPEIFASFSEYNLVPIQVANVHPTAQLIGMIDIIHLRAVAFLEYWETIQ